MNQNYSMYIVSTKKIATQTHSWDNQQGNDGDTKICQSKTSAKCGAGFAYHFGAPFHF